MTELSQSKTRATSRATAVRIARDVLFAVGLAAVYFGVARLSLAAATEHRVVSSIWPPAGIALFALLRFGVRHWPGVVLGAFALNASSGTGMAAAIGIAAGDTLEAVVGALLARRIMGDRRALDRPRDVLALTGLAGLVSTLIAATVGVATLFLSGSTSASSIVSLWLVWWTGDAVGVLVVTPFLLVWSTREATPEAERARRVEAALLFFAMAVLADLLFGSAPAFVFTLYPLAVWIAWRFGPRGAATATTVVALVATWRTLSGFGPFTTLSPTANLFALQGFVALFAVMALLFAAARVEAQQHEGALRVSEERYRQLAQNLPDGCVVLFDSDMRIVLAEGPAITAAGFTKAGVEGRRLDEIFDPSEAQALTAPFRSAIGGREQEIEFAFAGRVYLVRVLPLPVAAAGRSIGMALALDVTQREAAQREVAEGHAQLEQLSRLLLTAQEDERRRVAREVHDELGQALTAVKIGLSHVLSRATRRSSLESERRVATAADTLDRAIVSVQRIVLRLRPGVLDNLGPLAALEHEVQQFRDQTGIAVQLDLPPEPLTIEPDQSTALYRTVQEALTNVMRHAGASSVEVTLLASDAELVLQVNDNGRGISADQLAKPRSMGILGMRERAAACGGTLEITRLDGRGTCLLLRIPRRHEIKVVA